MNRQHFVLAYGAKTVHRSSDNVENAAQTGFAHGHHDRFAGILDFLAHGSGPSVTSMAMVRTTLSPRCCATSTTRLSGSSLIAGLVINSAV